MHYLEKEFQRLVKYTEGLGVKVTFIEDMTIDSAAAWLNDGSEIIIYNKSKKGPMSVCLDFIHELAHHLDYIHRGKKTNDYIDNILGKLETDSALTKKQRKALYEMEKSDSEFQKIIHKEVQSKIPLNRLSLQIEFDIWMYEYFYKNNKWPLKKDRKTKFKELRIKHV
jgi:hypothetical protein